MRPEPHLRLLPGEIGVPAEAAVVESYRRLADVFHEVLAEQSLDALLVRIADTLADRIIAVPDAMTRSTPLFDKRIDGFSVIFHMVSYQTVGLSTLQSRATAGVIGNVFVFCMPGSNGAVKDGWDKVISVQLDSRHKPCNFVEIMPRLSEK